MPFRLSRPVGFAVAGLVLLGLMAGASAPSPLYPVYQQLWGFSSFTLTVIFAVYVVALLGTLLTVGSLADHIGRRPMLVAGLLVLAVAMATFAQAGGVGALLLARILQGVATGAITGAANALIIDLQPNARIGSLVTGGSPAVGLALGAALAGGLVQHAPWPRELLFWVMLACYLLLAVVVLVAPEETRPRSEPHVIRRALRPSVGVAPEARSAFLSSAPALAAAWALGGLYLSLGSSALSAIFGIHDHFLVGLALAGFFTPAGLALLVVHLIPQAMRQPVGFASLGGGVVVTLLGVTLSSSPVYLLGSMIAGVGFGMTFHSTVSTIGSLTPMAERAQTFAAMYVLGYLAFSVPAVFAGLAAEQWGLRPTLIGYGALDVALVVAAALLAARAARHAAVLVPVPADSGCSETRV